MRASQFFRMGIDHQVVTTSLASINIPTTQL